MEERREKGQQRWRREERKDSRGAALEERQEGEWIWRREETKENRGAAMEERTGK